MAIASASSLLLPISLKTLSSSISRPNSLSSSSLPQKSISISPLFASSARHFGTLSKSRFVSKVAVSSEFDQDEQLSDGDEPTSFSPDLKVFVGNLPFNVDSAQLAGIFENVGNVEMVEVIYDKITGRSRGFAFVTMSTPAEVQAATQQLNGYELDGRPLRVNSGPPPRREETSFRGARGGGGGGDFGSSNRVYVGNLAWGVDDSALETLFSEQGQVVEAKVIYDRDTGRSKGFGFVTYSSAEEVNSAIRSLDGVDMDGRTIRVSVAESRPRRQF